MPPAGDPRTFAGFKSRETHIGHLVLRRKSVVVGPESSTAKRRRYTTGLKNGAVRDIRAGTKTVDEIAETSGAAPKLVKAWVRKLDVDTLATAEPYGVTKSTGKPRLLKPAAIALLRTLVSLRNSLALIPCLDEFARAVRRLVLALEARMALEDITHEHLFDENNTIPGVDDVAARKRVAHTTAHFYMQLIGARLARLDVGDTCVGTSTRESVLHNTLQRVLTLDVPPDRVANIDHSPLPDKTVHAKGVVLNDEAPNVGRTVTERRQGFTALVAINGAQEVPLVEMISRSSNKKTTQVEMPLVDGEVDWDSAESIEDCAEDVVTDDEDDAGAPGAADLPRNDDEAALAEDLLLGEADEGVPNTTTRGLKYHHFLTVEGIAAMLLRMLYWDRGLFLHPSHSFAARLAALEKVTLERIREGMAATLYTDIRARAQDAARRARKRPTEGDRGPVKRRGTVGVVVSGAAVPSTGRGGAGAAGRKDTRAQEPRRDSATVAALARAGLPELAPTTEDKVVSETCKVLRRWFATEAKDILTDEARRIHCLLEAEHGRTFHAHVTAAVRNAEKGVPAPLPSVFVHSRTATGLGTLETSLNTLTKLSAAYGEPGKTHIACILDRCGQFWNPTAVEHCRRLKMSVLFVTARCTGAFQPLDQTFNAALKAKIRAYDVVVKQQAGTGAKVWRDTNAPAGEKDAHRAERLLAGLAGVTTRVVARSWQLALEHAFQHARHFRAWIQLKSRASGRNSNMSGPAGVAPKPERFVRKIEDEDWFA